MAQRHATLADLPAEFVDTDEAVKSMWLEVAKLHVGLTSYRASALMAHMMLTSHYLKLAGEGTGTDGAQVTERKVGDVSEKYAVAPTTQDLSRTHYGRAYLSLRAGVVACGVVA